MPVTPAVTRRRTFARAPPAPTAYERISVSPGFCPAQNGSAVIVTFSFAGGTPVSVTRPDTTAVPSFPGGPAGAFGVSGAFGLQAAMRSSSARGVETPRAARKAGRLCMLSFGELTGKLAGSKTFDAISALQLCQTVPPDGRATAWTVPLRWRQAVRRE